MSLLDLVQRRLVIVTGKGGVGKTTVTAALARALSARGKRVLVGEIVPAADTPSQLHAALGGPTPEEEPTRVMDNVWVALLTPAMGHRRFLQDTLPIKLLADAAMRSQGLRKFLSAAPGFSDMGVMYRMLDLMRRPHPSGGLAFDVCLVDSPATGHALALAQIPHFLSKVIPGGPILRAAKDGLSVLTDPTVTGTVIVTLPETLPITEALELKKGLARHALPVSAIVVNRIPRDSFEPGERDAVRAVLGGQPAKVFGSRELQRLDRSDAALALLRAVEGATWVTLPDVDAFGAQASTQLAGHL